MGRSLILPGGSAPWTPGPAAGLGAFGRSTKAKAKRSKPSKSDRIRVQMIESSLHYRELKSHVKISLRQTNLFLGGLFTLGVFFYQPSLRSGSKGRPLGCKDHPKKGFPDEAKFSRGISILYNGVNFLAFEP